jgi:hypothetical protein
MKNAQTGHNNTEHKKDKTNLKILSRDLAVEKWWKGKKDQEGRRSGE